MKFRNLLLPAFLLAFTGSAIAQSGMSVVARGPDWNVLQTTNVVNGTNVVSHIIEAATGLNFTNSSGQLTESLEQITLQPGGASAVNGRHKVYFPSDIASGVIQVTTPDNRNLYSRPLCVCYDDGNTTVVIATLTNAVGWLTASNQVTYRNCFSGIQADLVCDYKRSGFDCSLVFREKPASPDQYGLTASLATLKLVTEFFDTADPQQIPADSDDAFGLQDTTLKFGKLTMTHGKAFAFKGANTNAPAAAGTPVYKSWLHLQGRTFLVEEVPLVYVAGDLDALPLSAMNQPTTLKPGGLATPKSGIGGPTATMMAISGPATPSRPADVASRNPMKADAGRKPGIAAFASRHPVFPPSHAPMTGTNQILLAALDTSREPGVVLDYTEVDSDQTDFAFISGETYFIPYSLNLFGTTTFSNAIIKFGSEGSLNIDEEGSINCNTGPYSPCVFTSMNDDSIGITVYEYPGSSGSPNFSDVGTILNIYASDAYLHDLRFSYAWVGINHSADYAELSVWDCQFANIASPISGCGIDLENVLIDQSGCSAYAYPAVTSLGSYYVEAENVTLDSGTYSGTFLDVESEDEVNVNLANCLLVNSALYTDSGTGTTVDLNTNCTVVLPSPIGPVFQTANGGTHYLTNNSVYRNAGTTSINSTLLAQLQQETTYPPASAASSYGANINLYPCVPRDTDTPDIGYHYDPIDWLATSLTVGSGATLTLADGAILASPSVTVSGTLSASEEIDNAVIQEASGPIILLIGNDPAAAYTDADGNGLPDWWEEMYFGTNGLNPNASYDGNGNSLLYDYLNGVNLNAAIQFMPMLGKNRHFNTTNAIGTFLLATPVPGYETVLVNDTNLTDAVWTNYDGLIHMSLGPTDGVYMVQIGLKDHAPGATSVWTSATVYLDRVAPQVTITSPASTNVTVTSPLLQLQGYANESLQGVKYAISNSVGVVTNLTGRLLGGQYFDLTQYEYTTDYFQCFDIGLTNGLNQITIYATDLAGNITTNHLGVTLNYATATNPVVNLYWPTANTAVVGSSFNWSGHVDDPASAVSAQITDTNGLTTVVNAKVVRDGKFWVDNLPLTAGTNSLTLSVTNAAGYVTTTNIVITQSTLNLTINTPTDDLWLPPVTVTGTFDDFADYTVWINGIKATNTSGNNWTAYAVPLPPGGRASIQARAIPNSNNGGNGTGGSGGGPVDYDNLGNPDPPSDNDAQIEPDKPTEVVMESLHTMSYSWDGFALETQQLDYEATSGGSTTHVWYDPIIDSDTYIVSTDVENYAPNRSHLGGQLTVHYADGETPDETTTNGPNGTTFGQNWEYGTLPHWFSTDTSTWSENEPVMAQLVLHTGGDGVSGLENLFALQASVYGLASGEPPQAEPPSQVTMDGNQLGADYTAWTMYPENYTAVITPQAGPPESTFGGIAAHDFPGDPTTTDGGTSALEYKLAINFAGQDVTDSNSAVIVGQLINPGCGWVGGSGPAITNFSWTVPGITFSNYAANNNTGTLYTDFSTTNSEVDFYWVDGGNKTLTCEVTAAGKTLTASTTFNVYRPDSSIAANINGPIAINEYNGGRRLHFGFPIANAQGMQFGGNVSMPPKSVYSGATNLEWVQLVSYSESEQTNDGSGAWYYLGPSSDALDTTYPYGTSTNFTGGNLFNTATVDSPFTIPLDNYIAVSRNDSMKLWLMFQPDGGQWVPLHEVNWRWSGAGQALSPTFWESSASPSPSVSDNQEATSHPQWITNVTAYFPSH